MSNHLQLWIIVFCILYTSWNAYNERGDIKELIVEKCTVQQLES